MSSWFSRRRAGNVETLTVAVLVPCHNEEKTMGGVVTSFRERLTEARVYVSSVGLLGWYLVVKLMRRPPQPGPLLNLYDSRLAPMLRRLESWARPRFGQSLFVVAQAAGKP